MTIYSDIGGREAVEAAVGDFYVRVLADPALEHYFTGVDMERLQRHQRAFIGMAFGGPVAYQGQDMKTAHAGLAIPGEDFDKVVGHLAATLSGLGVPAATIGQIAAAVLPLKPDIVAAGA